MSTPAFELRGATKRYGALTVLHPFDLTIGEGEFVTLLGPSGSGKTTLLGIAAGIVEPDGGRILARGKDITSQPPHLRDVGMVFQRYTLFPNKTVAENVAFPLLVRNVPAATQREQVAHFLDLVGLGALAGRYPSQISGGQAQRVALARALVFGPALLLMDEPLAALDRRLRQDLQEEIRRIQRETRTPTLYVTHDQDEALGLSDRIVIMRDGNAVAAGTPHELYTAPNAVWTASFLGDANSAPLVALDRTGDGHCVVRLASGQAFAARCGAGSIADPHVIIRPEDCIVHADGAPGWPGVVADLSFRGPVQHLRITLEGGWTIRAAIPARQPVAAGQAVRVGWDDLAPFVVPAEPGRTGEPACPAR